MHIVLLRFHLEIFDAPGNRVFMVDDVDLVIDDIPRMGYPLAAYHPLVVDVVAEGEFLDTGTQVEIITIRGNRVVVKKVED